MHNTIVIVGAGFCGTVLAAKLLRRPPPGRTDVVLAERRGEIGRGVAYAVRDFPYLLNVPAARLSADSDDALQFLRFARRRVPDADGEDFLPRSLYGDYLQEMLLQAERGAPAHIRLLRIDAEVCGIVPDGADQPLTVEFADRPSIAADKVVLALGNPPPALPPWAAAIRDHAAYRHDPWDLPKLGTEHSVLIVGNGLTMADAVSALTQDATHAPALHTISRRGLVPLPQTAFRPAAIRGDGEALLANAHSLSRVLAITRDLAHEVEARGGDWREVVTFVRHLAPSLWHRLPQRERRRFVRHLQAHWDTHRHRLPPQLAERLAALRRSGQLRVNAGRIDSVHPEGERLRVSWRPRGGGVAAPLTVDLIVNATGPDYSLDGSTDALFQSLRAAGLVCADALKLGLRTTRHGACLDAQGRAGDKLYYLGPMLRADHWESTAAPELRNHAERLAGHLSG